MTLMIHLGFRSVSLETRHSQNIEYRTGARHVGRLVRNRLEKWVCGRKGKKEDIMSPEKKIPMGDNHGSQP